MLKGHKHTGAAMFSPLQGKLSILKKIFLSHETPSWKTTGKSCLKLTSWETTTGEAGLYYDYAIIKKSVSRQLFVYTYSSSEEINFNCSCFKSSFISKEICLRPWFSGPDWFWHIRFLWLTQSVLYPSKQIKVKENMTTSSPLSYSPGECQHCSESWFISPYLESKSLTPRRNWPFMAKPVSHCRA